VSYVQPEEDYEKLALDELKAAASADTIDQRRAHLDQAAVYAARGERSRQSDGSSTP